MYKYRSYIIFPAIYLCRFLINCIAATFSKKVLHYRNPEALQNLLLSCETPAMLLKSNSTLARNLNDFAHITCIVGLASLYSELFDFIHNLAIYDRVKTVTLLSPVDIR